MNAIGGSGISDSFGSGGTGGLTPEEAQALIDASIGETNDNAEATGRNGWVISPTVDVNGVSAIDLSGVPADANEIVVRIQGLSTTAVVNLAMQFLNENGSVIGSPIYYGVMSALTSGVANAAWNAVGYCTLLTSMPAASFYSGVIRIVRMHPDSSWHITSVLHQGSAQYISAGHVSIVPCRGVRLGVVGSPFDAGTVGIAWRR